MSMLPFALAAARAEIQSISDRDLLAAMQSGRDDACAEFVRRYRPLLEAYARKTKIPRWEWDTCISEVLVDEMLRFSKRPIDPPQNLPAYLVKAVYHRYLRIKRSLRCRDKHHVAASVDHTGEWIVSSVCSESALRSSAGPDSMSRESESSTLDRFAHDLGRGLTDEERSILHWIAQGVSHREIAKWIGASYDATTKRIWRLCRRLRADAPHYAEAYAPAERAEVERFLRRAV